MPDTSHKLSARLKAIKSIRYNLYTYLLRFLCIFSCWLQVNYLIEFLFWTKSRIGDFRVRSSKKAHGLLVRDLRSQGKCCPPNWKERQLQRVTATRAETHEHSPSCNQCQESLNHNGRIPGGSVGTSLWVKNWWHRLQGPPRFLSFYLQEL